MSNLKASKHHTTLTLRLPPGEGSFSDPDKLGRISYSLLFSLVFHSSCHCAFVYERIFCFRSVKGMYELDILFAIASLATKSASSLPQFSHDQGPTPKQCRGLFFFSLVYVMKQSRSSGWFRLRPEIL